MLLTMRILSRKMRKVINLLIQDKKDWKMLLERLNSIMNKLLILRQINWLKLLHMHIWRNIRVLMDQLKEIIKGLLLK